MGCLTPEIPIERFEVFASGLDHPECLAFDRDGWLWAGGEAGQVYRISPDATRETIAEVGGFSRGFAWAPGRMELFIFNARRGIVGMGGSGAWAVFAGSLGV